MASKVGFTVNVGATLDTSDIPRELDRINAQLAKSNSTKIRFRLDTGQITTAIREINEFNSAVGKLKQVRIYDPVSGAEFRNDLTSINEGLKVVTAETSNWTNQLGHLVTQVRTVDNYGNTLIEETIRYTNAVGQEIEEIRLLDEQMNQLSDTTVNITNKTREFTTSTNTSFGQITDTVNGVTNTYNGLITTTEKVGSNNEYLRTVVSKYKNELNQVVVRTEQFDRANNRVAATERVVGDAISNTDAKVKSLGNSFSNAISTLTKYYLASLPIRAVQTAITETIETLKDFDDALIEFKKVSDLAGESLTEYVAKLAEMGEATGSTMEAMVEAATQFRKSGFSDKDSAALASLAEEFRNVADEEISAADSASFIIAQMKAFNIEAENAEHILDAVNEV